MSDTLANLRRRREKAWADKSQWNAIYREAWRWAVPYRRPSNTRDTQDKGQSRIDHIYDTTAIVSGFRGAGKMQQDLFPPGANFFRLKPGPVTKMVASAAGDDAPTRDLAFFERTLDSVAAQIAPFFQTGEWDNAASEMCLDAYVGTGVMLMLQGDASHPIRFVTLPIDECALEAGAYGDIGALYWRTRMTRRAIMAAFPKGAFPKPFLDLAQEGKAPDEEVDLYQDFTPGPSGKPGQPGQWTLTVTVEGASDSDPPVTEQTYRTQPFCVMRYYRVPGETHGRGPILLTIPTVKTLNRAYELQLKNFALNMLGLWGYRPGGTFNPDTAPKSPGSFWPMQSTGGVMGPDVFRLDTGGGRGDLSQIVVQDLRAQIQAALHDEQLPADGATPKSATEIMARVARIKQNYAGAYGRMIYEVIPVVIRRAMEVLYSLGLITVDLSIDQLLVSVDVISPMAQAMKADAYQTTVEAMHLIAQLEGPQAIGRYFKLDELLPQMIKDMGVNSNFVRSAVELTQWDQAAAQQLQSAALAQSMSENPNKFADAMQTVGTMAQQSGAGAPPPGQTA